MTAADGADGRRRERPRMCGGENDEGPRSCLLWLRGLTRGGGMDTLDIRPRASEWLRPSVHVTAGVDVYA